MANRSTAKGLGQGGKQGPVYAAKFEGLVDLVDDAGEVRYFVSVPGGGISIDQTTTIGGQQFSPPPRKHIRWTLPRKTEVVDAWGNDTGAALFEDLLKYFHQFTQLPTDGHYVFLTAWTFHTYMLEAFNHSGIVLFQGEPERGKTRAGKSAIHVAYRGIRTETMRPAWLIRAAQDYGVTVFFDVEDFQGKGRQDSESLDLLLARFEKGTSVARVTPDAGECLTVNYFDPFGASIIATNEDINGRLLTRCFPIVMPKCAKNFPDPTPELGLPFRERLVAWRAKQLGLQLPDPDVITVGRLQSIAAPLLQVVKLVSPNRTWELAQFVSTIEQERRKGRLYSTEASIVEAIRRRAGTNSSGEVSVADVAADTGMTADSIGRKLALMSFEPVPGHGKRRRVKFDRRQLDSLADEYGLDS